MKKRALSLFLALVMCLGLLPMTALAADEDDFTIKDGKLTKYNGPGGDVVIPEGVTKIGWMAFDSCTTLTSVTFPDGVTYIGNAAFNGCTSLTSVTFPDSLDYIDTDAFSNCPSLDELVIPDSVTRYSHTVSNSVRKLTFGSGLADPLRDGNSGWLLNNKNLTSLTIRGRVQTIDHEVFIACRNLTEIHYSGTLKEWREALDAGAFRTVYDPNAYSNAMWCIPNATVYCSDGTIAAGTGNVRASDADSSSGHGEGSSDHGGDSQGAPQTGDLFLGLDFGQLPGSRKLEFIVGQPLGELPTPTREGYIFDGWYTANIGGSRVTSSTTVQTDFLTIYAHWTKIPEEVTLYFNSNGGSSVSSKTVTTGQTYGDLSTPTREGYTFDGWYTAKTGGSKVTSSTTVTDTYDHTLYARWKEVSVQPEQPVTPAAKTAAPTNDKLTVDGVLANPTVYKIDGGNYFKIRDVAALLNGTEKQFSVGYDGKLKSVTATTGEGYTKLDTDLLGEPAGGNKTAEPSNDTIYINGVKIDAEVYKINGGNYFKLRDLGKALNFAVDWTREAGVMIDTSKPYTE